MHRRQTDPEALRQLIAQRDMTLVAFACAAAISYSHIKYVLAGERELSDRAAHRVARVLDVALDDFTRPDSRTEAVA